MNSCILLVCILAFVATVQSDLAETPLQQNHRGLQHHSIIIEVAYLSSAAAVTKTPRNEKADHDDEEPAGNTEVPGKTAKAVESHKSTKIVSVKKPLKASDKGAKLDISKSNKKPVMPTGKDDSKAPHSSKDDVKAGSEIKEERGNMTATESKQESGKGASTKRPKSSKGCRRLGNGAETVKEKRSKGAGKKIPLKKSSTSSKGSNKLTKSEEDDENDSGEYSGGGRNHTNSKSKSKAEKDYSDDHKTGKSEKHPDDTEECEEGTDPPTPSRSPSPGIPASEEDVVIPLSPYFVLYEIEQTRIPLLSDYDELAAFTSSYLDNYFRSAFANTAEIFYVGSRTLLLASEFRLAQAVRIDYETNVTFTSTSLIPAESELESITLGAFEGSNGEAYAAAVASGVPADNIFSTTSTVFYTIVESSIAIDSRGGSKRVGSMIYAINAGLIALVVLLHQWRSRKGSILSKPAVNGGKLLVDERAANERNDDKDEQQQMRNIIEGWKVGIGPVLSSMKGSIASSVRQQRQSSRGGFAYHTVRSSTKTVPQTCSST